jgi:hypothetical protein
LLVIDTVENSQLDNMRSGPESSNVTTEDQFKITYLNLEKGNGETGLITSVDFIETVLCISIKCLQRTCLQRKSTEILVDMSVE